MLFSESILQYHFNLKPDLLLPPGVEWLIPYADPETRKCMSAFYDRFYQDTNPRFYILGINPGRFGGGLTGVPFTDPKRLELLGIQNAFPKKQELSSVFMYDMIDACGDPEIFYAKFYITSLSPLGLTKNGVNYNYYDDVALSKTLEPFIIANIEAQIQFGCNMSSVFCLGQGKNYDFLRKLNDRYQWWDRVIPLPHPRWIMQYRLKEKEAFIEMYKTAFDLYS